MSCYTISNAFFVRRYRIGIDSIEFDTRHYTSDYTLLRTSFLCLVQRSIFLLGNGEIEKPLIRLITLLYTRGVVVLTGMLGVDNTF